MGIRPNPDSLVVRFEQIAARFPERCALRHECSTWSYSELNARANRLAHLLIGLGVKPETPVAVFATRSPATLLAFLAILKAGGAYVPLDPSYPADLIRFYLEDTHAPLVLADPQVQSRLPETSARVIALSENPVPDESPENPSARTGPRSLAHILFTSGSTGRPKGVLIEHRGVLRVAGDISFAEVDSQDVFLQAAPLNFDASTFEIWTPWLHGACLVLPPPGILSLHDLGAAIRNFGVSTLWLTAGLFQLMVEQEIESLAGVRQLLTGGDVVSPIHAERLLKTYPRIRLINGYGPTEGTVFTSCHRIELTDPMPERLSIGRPISHTDVLILDENLKALPRGETGEIVITGEGVARGYLNRPDLTEQRFVEVADGAGNRVRGYRSGDLGRYRADGNLEFFGRRDHQVKIRGLRIELDELENVLQAHADVSHAIVMALGVADQKHLEAFVVLKENARQTERALRQYLAQRFPANWLPSNIHFLSTLPLNVNGKVDRKSFQPLAPAFPDPQGLDFVNATPVADARDDIEKLIWAIWREMLPGATIRRTDNFFDLGGDSLSAMKMLAQVEKALDCKLTLQPMIESGTIAALADAARGTGSLPAPPLMTCVQEGHLPPFFFAHGDYMHGGLFCQALAREVGTDRPFYAIGTPGFYDGKLPATIEDVATTNLALIRSVQPSGPYYLGGFCNAALAMYEVAQRLLAEGEEVAALIMLDPPDFCFPHLRAPIERLAKVLNLSNQRRVLLEDFVLEAIYRWDSYGAWATARYVAGRLSRYPISRLKSALKPRQSAPSTEGNGGINLNFYYLNLIMEYNVKPYRGSSPVTMLLRRAEKFRHPHQIHHWSRMIRNAQFDLVVGTHLDFRASLPDLGRSIREGLETSPAEVAAAA